MGIWSSVELFFGHLCAEQGWEQEDLWVKETCLKGLRESISPMPMQPRFSKMPFASKTPCGLQDQACSCPSSFLSVLASEVSTGSCLAPVGRGEWDSLPKRGCHKQFGNLVVNIQHGFVLQCPSYRVEEPAALAELQKNEWDPIVAWAEKR